MSLVVGGRWKRLKGHVQLLARAGGLAMVLLSSPFAVSSVLWDMRKESILVYTCSALLEVRS